MGKIIHVLVLTGIIMLSVEFSFAQGYPQKIPAGQEKTLKVDSQALWVLKESQFDQALADSKKLKVVEEKVEQLQKIKTKLKEKSVVQDSLIDTLKNERQYYRNLWKQTEKDLKTMGAKTIKQRRWKTIFKYTSIIGIPLAFVTGLFL